MKRKILSCVLLAVMILCSCKKYLDEKPNKKLSIPSTVEDCQALLDLHTYINSFVNNAVGEVSSDNYYLTSQTWGALTQQSYRDMYTWGEEIFYDNGPSQNEWSSMYTIVYRANVVLEVMDKVERTELNNAAWNNAYGSALFLRAEAFSVLARNFAKAYTDNSQDLGIPLRMTSDFNTPSVRATVQDSYDQIIRDAKASVPYLPQSSAHVMRPSKAAAYGLLARVYLSMRLYDKAALYADSSLQIANTLIDYNGASTTAAFPFDRFNPEVLYFAQGGPTPLTNTRARIDSVLFLSYAANDLRKSLFFKSNGDGSYNFKGNYTSSVSQFVGIATDEMYLTKAEAVCRNGDFQEGLKILNQLMVKRWKQGTFIPFSASNQSQALAIILSERRKELLMRDLRWIDIKRLNLENANISLKRVLDNGVYTLPPNDNRFALPLPAKIVAISHMPQNPR